MGQFRFQNWNRNQPLFKLDGIGIGIESTTNFSVGIGIGIDPALPGIDDIILNWNRNRNWNLTTVSGIGIGIGIQGAGIVPSVILIHVLLSLTPRNWISVYDTVAPTF